MAASVRKLVGFYNVSYADGLAVCGAVAREMLSQGRSSGLQTPAKMLVREIEKLCGR